MSARGLGLALALWAGLAAAQPRPAGEITLVTGRGTASAPDGGIRNLAKGDTVYSGEVLNAGPNSYVNIKFTDGGFTLLRPNTRFEIEDYAFDAPAAPAAAATPATPPVSVPVRASAAPVAAVAAPPRTPPRAFFRLLKGGFRAVTGLVGKLNREDYRVNTPVATIGIRGTDITVIDCDAACQSDPVIFDALQGFPPGTSATGASILIVNSGEATITNSLTGVTSSVPAGGVVLSLPTGEQIVLTQQPQFIQNDPPPPPDACGA